MKCISAGGDPDLHMIEVMEMDHKMETDSQLVKVLFHSLVEIKHCIFNPTTFRRCFKDILKYSRPDLHQPRQLVKTILIVDKTIFSFIAIVFSRVNI